MPYIGVMQKDKSQNQLYYQIAFYSIWLAALIIQSIFTELYEDEAYYWMYSRHLSWGYFDHPPVIAIMVKFGYFLFKNELGVRLLAAVFNTFAIYIIEIIITPKNKILFYLLVSSVAIIHLFGFVATPDSALFLAAALFLLYFKKFLENQNISLALWLGCSMAFLILSKYHGLLLIGFTLMVNFKLLKNKNTWIALFVMILLLIPHFLWQMFHHFPSMNYHLLERSLNTYKINYTLEYLASQLFILGPLTGFVFFYTMLKIKSRNSFEKTLKFIFWTIYIFFFIMTFKGRVEPHWTFIAIIPALYFGYEFLETAGFKKIILVLVFGTSILLIIVCRILILSNFIISKDMPISSISEQFHNKEFMFLIKKKAGNNIVAFMNSYQKASLYNFYTSKVAFSINNIMGRKNQFDLWECEDLYRGKKVMVVLNYDEKAFDTIDNIYPAIYYKFVNDFQVFSKIKIVPLYLNSKVKPNTTENIVVKILNPSGDTVDLERNKEYPTQINYCFFKDNMEAFEGNGITLSNSNINHYLLLPINFPKEEGKYSLYFSLRTGWLPNTYNSKRYTIYISD